MSRWNPAADSEQAHCLLFSLDTPDAYCRWVEKASQETKDVQLLYTSLQIVLKVYICSQLFNILSGDLHKSRFYADISLISIKSNIIKKVLCGKEMEWTHLPWPSLFVFFITWRSYISGRKCDWFEYSMTWYFWNLLHIPCVLMLWAWQCVISETCHVFPFWGDISTL